jgi:hypothetical protein
MAAARARFGMRLPPKTFEQFGVANVPATTLTERCPVCFMMDGSGFDITTAWGLDTSLVLLELRSLPAGEVIEHGLLASRYLRSTHPHVVFAASMVTSDALSTLGARRFRSRHQGVNGLEEYNVVLDVRQEAQRPARAVLIEGTGQV